MRYRDKEEHFCPVCRANWKENELLQLMTMDFEKESDHNENENEKNASKMSGTSTKLAALLISIQKTDPDDKIIVFSQWTSFLDLIEPILPVSFVRLDGSMSQSKRESAIKSFQENPKIKVLIASLRSCGVGLNLTVANRIFLMDLWWNVSTEQQAIDRVHRLGQTKPVHVVKFVIRDSVEEKILDLQEKKLTLTNHVIDMNQTNDNGKATVETLLSLF
jgi:DNA repair protein RAD5